MEYLKEVRETVAAIVPREAEVTSVDLEGPEIAVYTKNPRAFHDNEDYVKSIAHQLKKKVNIRSDKSLLIEEKDAREKIMQIVPPEAKIADIQFMEPFSEVVIEALKPGLVIGKSGLTSKEIILQTGWTPRILRSPTAPSEMLKGIRHHLVKYSSERKKILQETAKKIYSEKPSPSWVRLTPLGGFRQVGRSCMLVETRRTKVLIDCGINVSNSDPDEAYPYLDAIRFPISELDAIILSHAHMDHCGFIPYLFKAGYRGPVYCTEPTRDLAALLLFDYIDVMAKENKEAAFSERDVKEMLKYCITRDYREVTDIAPDMRLTFHNAAHVLGSASVHLHIGEGAHNLVYSADIKYGFTRLFNNVDINYPRLETLIVESTYGGKDDIQTAREETEAQFLRIIQETTNQGGCVLIPVFAVGRAQEIQLVIENYYRKGLIDPDVKVYVDGMTRESSAIHTAYPEYLRNAVQKRVLQNDSPFTSSIFQVAKPEDRDAIVQNGKAIILASSGMLTGGPSVQYFYKLAENPINTLTFVGYQGEGSLGRKILGGIKSLPLTENDGRTRKINVNLRIEKFDGFSGHSDRPQLSAYVRNLKPKPKRILTDHGEATKCVELAKYFSAKFAITSQALRNLDSVRLK
ncbi:MAG TPA: beta-CASP ribonuclease aCPSF1 [Candidatus Diapherotrites archaeon]|uniref:Transcription termination factor FttA n=1 Tax=Candidatus Iainarchaeum sp. TaxID=3101447 RepID=A0A7J4IYS7_9ARCH|nr:beta-CASP ribonuclease aCPSF1 [Candidatus Diapherotrites archaeon]